jgi:hypothetical protein
MPANCMEDLQHVTDLHDVPPGAVLSDKFWANESIAMASQPIYLSNWLAVICFQ